MPDQNWANLNTAFTKIYTDKNIYFKVMAYQTRFVELATNIEEEVVKESKDAVIVFIILQQSQ